MMRLTDDHPLTYAVGSRMGASDWVTVHGSTISQLYERLSHHAVRQITLSEYLRITDGFVQSNWKDVGSFMCAELWEDGAGHGKHNVKNRTAVVLDIDDGTGDPWEAYMDKFPFTACIYSTFKHTPQHPRMRLVIPLSRPVDQNEFFAASRWVAGEIGIESVDQCSFRWEQIMFFPACPSDGTPFFDYQDGPVCTPEQLLGNYANYLDVTQWPRKDGENLQNLLQTQDGQHLTMGAAPSIHRQSQCLPSQEVVCHGGVVVDDINGMLRKVGFIGLFNRAFYPIQVVLDEELSGYYWKVSERRYRYAHGSGNAGLLIYDDDTVAYSRHTDHDPVGIMGKCVNAFDLARVHLFGSMDKGHESEKMYSRPSFKAMVRTYRNHWRIIQQQQLEKEMEVSHAVGDEG